MPGAGLGKVMGHFNFNFGGGEGWGSPGAGLGKRAGHWRESATGDCVVAGFVTGRDRGLWGHGGKGLKGSLYSEGLEGPGAGLGK